MINTEKLFDDLYWANTESEVTEILLSVQDNLTWKPYGNNESNFGVMEAQQAEPVPALVEKLTNSIDAILMKRCLEEGIDPKSKKAPKSVEGAIKEFFPNAQNWDLPEHRRQQAESLQILAHGPRRETSLVIYDDGEGQHPEDFEGTFLSLLKGNKTEIQFVQGKYNMGGAGAIVFCGKEKYQLVASKKYDETGLFGFTLVRRHPLSGLEKETRRSTWYEYLTIDDKIPRFEISELDLGLHNRKFTTGSIIKLYSYQLPSGSVPINRDLSRSINELLFDPALPFCIVEQYDRYPNDKVLQRIFYGLKRSLEKEDNGYIQDRFQQSYKDKEIGEFTATVYVFNTKVDGKTPKETRDFIRNEYFKNNMSVSFSLNGQVHAPFTSEFVSRTLKYQLIKDYLLIHVDCTELEIEFRNELFMASRDRAKGGDEMNKLRSIVGRELKKGRLEDIYKQRKANIGNHGEDSSDLLRNFSKNLPLKSDLLSLLNQTFKLEKPNDNLRKSNGKQRKRKSQEESFDPKRFPSMFKLVSNEKSDSHPLFKIPQGNERTIRFSTDVEDAFFERVEDPGELKMGLLNIGENEGGGGTKPGLLKKIEDVFSVGISSPTKGTIRVNLKPEQEVNVGDSFTIEATLSSKAGKFHQIFRVQITKPDQPKQKIKQSQEEEQIGLPKAVKVFEQKTEGHMDWATLNDNGVEIDHNIVMRPYVEDDKLEKIYINMDSSVMKNFRSKLKSIEQMDLASNRYFSAVYFHTLFLYMISKRKGYQIRQMTDGEQVKDVDLEKFLSDLFSFHYSEFLMNFEMETLLESMSSL